MSTQNIKTWEDIVNMDNRYHQLIDDIIRSGYSSLWDSKVIGKIIATLKIAEIIEFGYGGMVTDEECDCINPLYIIKCDYKGNVFIDSYKGVVIDKIVTFRTQESAEEFMSYPKNVELIRNYYML